MTQANALIEKDIFFHFPNLMTLPGDWQLFKPDFVNFAANIY